MGGCGSGKWERSSSKRTAESCRSIDVRRLYREGLLAPGTSFGWKWSREGKQLAEIGVMVGEDLLTLTYRYRRGEGEWQSIDEPVSLVWTSCNYGGQRPWLVCPGVRNGIPCGRRVAVLYLGGRHFLCRHCYELVYQSQREDGLDRARRCTRKIRLRLGGTANLFEPFPDKPRGMHYRTYLRLLERAAAAEGSWITAFVEAAERQIDRESR